MVTSLSRAVQDLNHHVDVILPKFDCLNLSNVSFVAIALFHMCQSSLLRFSLPAWIVFFSVYLLLLFFNLFCV